MGNEKQLCQWILLNRVQSLILDVVGSEQLSIKRCCFYRSELGSVVVRCGIGSGSMVFWGSYRRFQGDVRCEMAGQGMRFEFLRRF